MNPKTEKVLGHDFVGPYPLTVTDFNNVAGIYLITTSDGNVVDVGETDNLKERIPNHERESCWNRNSGINLWFHFDNNRDQRLLKEKMLRTNFSPVCGIK